MFGVDGIFAFPNGELVFVVFVVVMDIAMIAMARKFFKKI